MVSKSIANSLTSCGTRPKHRRSAAPMRTMLPGRSISHTRLPASSGRCKPCDRCRAHGSWTSGDVSYWSAATITIGPIAVCSAGMFTMCSLVAVNELPTRLPGTSPFNLETQPGPACEATTGATPFVSVSSSGPRVEFCTSVTRRQDADRRRVGRHRAPPKLRSVTWAHVRPRNSRPCPGAPVG